MRQLELKVADMDDEKNVILGRSPKFWQCVRVSTQAPWPGKKLVLLDSIYHPFILRYVESVFGGIVKRRVHVP